MDVARFALRHEKLIIFLVAVLAAAGIYEYAVVPQSIFPAMSFSRIDIVASVGELPPEQVRVAVTSPLERRIQALPSVLSVRSMSSQGNAELLVEFDPKTDPRIDLEYVNQAINEVRSSLPRDASVFAAVVSPNNEPVVSFAMTSGVLSQTVLREIATRSVVPAFAGIPGLGRVLAVGGATREYHVVLDPAALATRGLTSDDVSKALATAANIQAVGLAQRYYRQSVLLIDAAPHDAATIGNVVVPTADGTGVPLAALGVVELGVSPLVDQAAYNGRHAVVINAYALPGANAVALAAAFTGRFENLRAHLPAGIELHKFWDQTALITDSQHALRDAILLGALLAIGVIFLFLRDLRMTLVAAAVIPIAMAIAVFVIGHAGMTLNLMTVGGLAVAVGLIIDDAIVVIENVARHLAEQPHTPRAELLRLAMAQISGPMITSTATTVVVFIPLALLSGVPGFFFRALAITLGTTLIVSLLLALFFAPILAKEWIGAAARKPEHHGLIARLLAHYEPMLRWTLGHRRAMYAGAAGVLVVTVLLLWRLPSDFLPKMDEGQFEIAYTMPVGTTLTASDKAATLMEKIVKRDPAVLAEGRLTGIDSNGFSPMPQNRGLLRISMVPHSQRSSFDAVSSRLRTELAAAVPAAQFDVHQILEDMINDISGAAKPIEVSVQGPDQRQLATLANRIANKLSSIPGVQDVFNGVNYEEPVVAIAPSATRLAGLGAAASDVAASVSASAQGTIAASVTNASLQVPIRVQLAGASNSAARADLGLSDLPVLTSHGITALQGIAQVVLQPLATDVEQLNGRRQIRVTANIGNANLSSVITRVRQALATVSLPPGYTVNIGGRYHAQQASFREFLAVIVVAVGLVLAAMLAAFRSYRPPLVILTAIPLALIGVALGLFVTGTPFNVSSFMGLLLLVGIVVKNGILLIDVANKRLEAGDAVEQALVVAGRTRLRPIVMTTLAAIGGLLPLALGSGSGAEMERPLAIAVIGGLSTATAFTLILIPVLYASFVGSAPLENRERQAA